MSKLPTLNGEFDIMQLIVSGDPILYRIRAKLR